MGIIYSIYRTDEVNSKLLWRCLLQECLLPKTKGYCTSEVWEVLYDRIQNRLALKFTGQIIGQDKMIFHTILDWITVFMYIGFTSLIIWIVCFKQSG